MTRFYRYLSRCRVLLPFVLLSFCVTLTANAENAHKIRVAIYKGAGAHPRNQLFEYLGRNMDVESIEADDLLQGCLKDFDVLLVPGGSGKKESRSMADEGREEVRRFVGEGGLYLGICAGAYLSSDSKDYLGLLPFKVKDREHWQRGKAVLPVELTPLGREVFGVDHNVVHVLYHNGPILPKIDEEKGGAPNPELRRLATFKKEIVAPDGEVGIMLESPAAVFGHYKRGRVIVISPHFEADDDTAGMIDHAIQWLYEHRAK